MRAASAARLRMGALIGGLTAGQFAIFDSMLPAIGIDKFHYHEPH